MLRDNIPLLMTYYGPIGTDLRLGEVTMRMQKMPNRAARPITFTDLRNRSGMNGSGSMTSAMKWSSQTCSPRCCSQAEATPGPMISERPNCSKTL